MDLSKKYDIICTLVDRIIKKYNPCNIHEDDNKIVCKRSNICCKGCIHLSDKGCKVDCLGCKFGFCYTLRNDINCKKAIDSLIKLYILAFLHDFTYIRSSKREIFTHISESTDRDVKYRHISAASCIQYIKGIQKDKLFEFRNKYYKKRNHVRIKKWK